MKYLSSILLFTALAILLYINVGDLARISYGLVNAKSEASEKIKAFDNIQQLIIPMKDIASGEAFFPEKNEVRYHGKLYDVASQSQDGNNLNMQVVQDEKEEGLLSDLKEHVEQWFNFPQKNTNKRPGLKQTDLLKDFIPSEKLALLVQMPFVSLYSTIAYPLDSPSIPVVKSPPKLG